MELNGRNACHWFANMKLSRIIILITIALFVLPFLIHYYLPTMERSNQITHGAHSHVDLPEDVSSFRDGDLKTRIDELLRIKGSVSSELRDMENKRQKLQQDLQSYTKTIESLKAELLHQQTNLNRLKISVQQAQVAQQEALQQNTPDLALPNRLIPNELPPILPALPKNRTANCRMFSCFDHSRCSLTSGFPVYFYDPDRYPVMSEGWDVDGFLKTTLKQALGYNAHLTSDPKEACIYLVLVGEALRDADDLSGGVAEKSVESRALDSKALQRLPYWGGDGRNHVLLNLARRDLSAGSGDLFSTLDTGGCFFCVVNGSWR